MKDLNVNELGMVDMTNYPLSMELLSGMDKNDSYLYDSIIAGPGGNYDCCNCSYCFK